MYGWGPGLDCKREALGSSSARAVVEEAELARARVGRSTRAET